MSILEHRPRLREPAAEPVASVPTAVLPAWGPVQRVAFRFVFVYLILYVFSSTLVFVPSWVAM